MTQTSDLPGVVPIEHGELVPAPASVDAVMAHVQRIQDAMSRAMKAGEHYGIVPGTDKPALFKSGAEKLVLMFRLRPRFQIEMRNLPDGHREYQIVAELIDADGQPVGQGLGLCTTMESHYRYRTAKRTCPACGSEAIIKGREDWGGGWVCLKKIGGCGVKFGNGEAAIEEQPVGRVENPDLADCYNTVLKMAKKRALVDAILTVTAASDTFSPDLEAGQGAGKAQGGTAPAGSSPASPGPRQEPTQADQPVDPNKVLNDEQRRFFLNRLAEMRLEYGDVIYDRAIAEMTPKDPNTIVLAQLANSYVKMLRKTCEALKRGTGQPRQPGEDD